MKGEYQILKDGELLTYSNYKDIPEKFDNVIKFLPEYIKGPHTDDDHTELELLNEKLKNLLERENARSN